MSNVTRMPNVSQQSWPPSGDCGCDGGGWGGSGGGWWMLQNCWNQLNSFTQFLVSLLNQTVVSTLGVTDGTEAAPGQVGEILSASGTTIVNSTTSTTAYTVINTLSLSPGDWGIYANFYITTTGLTGETEAWLTLMPTSVPLADTDGTPPGQGVAWQGFTGAVSAQEGGTVGPVRVIGAAAVPIDLRVILVATAGQAQVVWSMTARRIR
jgi:hypothetical protein